MAKAQTISTKIEHLHKKGVATKKQRGSVLLREKLRDDIMWLDIEPCTALDEVALAKKYEVSRTPVREALLLLEREGYVQFLPNRTTIVAPLTMSNIPAMFDTFLLLARSTARAAAGGDLDEETLRSLVNVYRSDLSVGAIRSAFEAQITLYRLLAQAANNRFLAKYLLEVQDASIRLKQIYFFPNLTEETIRQSSSLLEAIVNAVIAADEEAADNAVVASILFESDKTLNSLGPKFGHLLDVTSPFMKDHSQ